MAKKIEFILDVDSKPIDVAVDATLNLKQQFRELSKELNRTKEGTKEFELLSAKLGDVKDNMDTTAAKSKDLFGSLSMLPGPVGQFAGSIDSAIGSLKTFTSFSFKDLNFQLGETINDFKGIASNIGKATGITKIYTTLNNALAGSFVKVGVGEAAAATGARAFAAALTATGIGALIVGLGLAVSALMEYANAAETAAEKQKELNDAADKMAKETLDVESQSIKRQGDLLLASEKARGASAKKIFDIEQQNRVLLLDSQERYYNSLTDKDSEEGRKTVQTIKNTQNEIKVAEQNFKAEQLKENQAKNEKLRQQNKQADEKILADRKIYFDKLNSLKNENQVLDAKNEYDAERIKIRQAAQGEELEIKALKLKDEVIKGILVTGEQKRGELLEALRENTAKKLQAVDDKQAKTKQEKDQERYVADFELYKKMQADKNQMIEDDYERQKKILQDAFEEERRVIIFESKASQLIRAQAAYALQQKLDFDLEKLRKDKMKKDSQLRLEELDEELKFLQIKQEAITQGTIQFYDAQRDILQKSLNRELAAIDDKLLNEKIKEEDAEKQKLEIKKKYSKAKDEINKQEINAYLGYVTAGLNTASSMISKQQEINSLKMDKELQQVKGNAEKEDKIKEKYFYKNRDAQKAQAIISTLQSAVSAYSSLAVIPVVGPALGAVAAAAALVFGYKQVKLIGEQTYQSSIAATSTAPSNPAMANYGRNYEKGGMIGGKRHAEGGTLIEAEKGEAIMTRGAVTMFAPMLSMMNQMGGGTSFSRSAMTTSTDNPIVNNPAVQQSPMIVKTYVVSSELTSEQNKQARLKDLSTL
jgi:hypothetical protein